MSDILNQFYINGVEIRITDNMANGSVRLEIGENGDFIPYDTKIVDTAKNVVEWVREMVDSFMATLLRYFDQNPPPSWEDQARAEIASIYHDGGFLRYDR